VRRAVVGTVCALAVFSGLGGQAIAGAAPKRSVVAAFYPIAYAAQQVGGQRVSVYNLTPAGAEPHDLELSPAQMDRLLDADAVFVMGHGFQPAVEKATQQRDGVTVDLLDKLPINGGSKPKGSQQVKEGDPSALDPHVWLDPVLMQDIVRQVQRGLTKADPKGAATYAANAAALVTELGALDEKFRTGLSDCSRTLIVTSHEAFGYLAARYGLRQEGAAGIDPTAEPDAKRIAELTDLVKKYGVTVVFTETLVSPRIADTLAREAGVKTDTLNPLEGLTDKEQAAGADYFTVMDSNLRKLRAALGCS
jgi:zinc transport system substrate-binding protein